MNTRAILIMGLMAIIIIVGISWQTLEKNTKQETKPQHTQTTKKESVLLSHETLVQKGEYIATIGVCNACHTPPDVPQYVQPNTKIKEDQELKKRVDPDWIKYLDEVNELAGGVPFIIRVNSESSGVVYSKNITPDLKTGIGSWTDEEIERVLRTGIRKDSTNLFLFAPHTFFRYLADDDMQALIAYLRSVRPVNFEVPKSNLPFPTQAVALEAYPNKAPVGRTEARAKYLTKSLVGCEECHSHTGQDGQLRHFVGGDPIDSHLGVFRLGPDLPLRPYEKGLAAFPYPGYAVLYGGNLTRFGKGGDYSDVPVEDIAFAIKNGVSTQNDEYGRPKLLSHVMLWQYYQRMKQDDLFAIAEYIKNLEYVEHDIGPNFYNYGDRWDLAFQKAFGEMPSENDKIVFGKK